MFTTYIQVLTKRSNILEKYYTLLNWTPNIWMGVTVENDKVTNRIDSLRKVPAFIRFLSIEPLISAIPKINLLNIDWVIVGGESGQKSRPIKEEWVLDIKDQCEQRQIPFFFKQWEAKIKKYLASYSREKSIVKCRKLPKNTKPCFRRASCFT